jgi:hypothetical protein
MVKGFREVDTSVLGFAALTANLRGARRRGGRFPAVLSDGGRVKAFREVDTSMLGFAALTANLRSPPTYVKRQPV